MPCASTPTSMATVLSRGNMSRTARITRMGWMGRCADAAISATSASSFSLSRASCLSRDCMRLGAALAPGIG